MRKNRAWREGFLEGYEKGSLEVYEELRRILTSGHNHMEMGVQVKARQRSIQERIEAMRMELGPGDAAGGGEMIHADLAPGHAYLYRSAETRPLLMLFSNLIGQGYRGMLVFRWNPEVVRSTLGTSAVAYHHLSTDSSADGLDRSGHHLLTPGDLSMVANTIVEWCRGDVPPVVLLQGLEFLAAHNDFTKVQKLMHTIVDRVANADGILLVCIDPNAFDQTQYSKLAVEMRDTLGA